jgi:hypothetical protein
MQNWDILGDVVSTIEHLAASFASNGWKFILNALLPI